MKKSVQFVVGLFFVAFLVLTPLHFNKNANYFAQAEEDYYPWDVFQDTIWGSEKAIIEDWLTVFSSVTLTIGGGDHIFKGNIDMLEDSKIILNEGNYDFNGEIILNTGSEMTLRKGNYVFEKNVYLQDNAKLRIEKGVNVKFRNVDGVTPSIFVDGGSIESWGMAEERITFSPIDENSNNYHIYLERCLDENVSVFNFVDFVGGGELWSTGGGGGVLSFLKMFFETAKADEEISGIATMQIKNSRVHISNSKFEKGNFFAIDSSLSIGTRIDDVKFLEVSETDFVENQNHLAIKSSLQCSIGAYNCEGAVLLNNNWYDSVDGPKTDSHPERNGDLVRGFEVLDWSEQAHFPDTVSGGASNVMFLPGLEASRLYGDKYSTCPYDENGMKKAWEPNCNEDVRGLYLDSDGKSLDPSIYAGQGDVLDETPVGSNIYKSFIDKMNKLKNDDLLINDWKPVAYDWRLSLNDILEDGSIEDTLRELAQNSKSGKVTIVAHSNGGLLTKALIQELGDGEAKNLIDKIIFVAVPQVGTPSAVAAMLHGYKQNLFPVLDTKTARGLGENMPGAYNLLPSEKYYSSVETPIVTFDTDSSSLWKDHFFDEIDSKNELHDFLVDDFWRVPAIDSDVDTPTKLNAGLLGNAQNLHDSLDTWTAPEGVKIVQIAGWGVPSTLSSTEYGTEARNFCDDFSCTNGIELLDPDFKFTIDGDGTVVTPSALWMKDVERYWVNIRNYNKNNPFETMFGFLGISHANIIELADVSDFIYDSITNNVKQISEYEYFSTEVPQSTGKRLQYSLHSPLTLDLYDNQNRHTGINENGEIEEQIPGTYFKQFGDVKYIFTDEDVQGQLVMKGYAEGTFTLAVEEFEGDNSTGKVTFKDMPTTPQTIATMNIKDNLESISALEIDKNGDQEIDFSLEPKIDEIVNFDSIAPMTTSNVDGIFGTNEWLTSEAILTLSANDNPDGSGVRQTKYQINDEIQWQDYQDPITFSQEGIFEVRFFSMDNFANEEEQKTITIKIDKTAPEAKFVFNPIMQKLDVTGIDNLSRDVSAQIVEQEEIQFKVVQHQRKIFKFFSWLQKEKESVKKIIVTAVLTDQAGHKTEIVWEKGKDKNHQIDLNFSSISYDNQKTEIETGNLQYNWVQDWRKRKFNLFASHLKTNESSIESHYFAKKNQTWIMEKPSEFADDESDDNAEWRPVWKKLSGMVIPAIITEAGQLKISY